MHDIGLKERCGILLEQLVNFIDKEFRRGHRVAIYDSRGLHHAVAASECVGSRPQRHPVHRAMQKRVKDRFITNFGNLYSETEHYEINKLCSLAGSGRDLSGHTTCPYQQFFETSKLCNFILLDPDRKKILITMKN